MTVDTREKFLWGDQATSLTEVIIQQNNPNVTALAKVLARKAGTELCSIGGSLNRLRDGRFDLATKFDMRELCDQHVVSYRHVNRGTTARARYEVEWFSFAFPVAADLNKEPNERVLIDLLNALVPLVVKGPSAPVAFKPQQLFEIRTRLKQSEPAAQIAKSYNVEPEAILEVKRTMTA
jgi:hypothetical protein